MEIDKRNIRSNCIICEKEMKTGRNFQGTSKSVRYLTCSKKCSKAFMRTKVYILAPYFKRIKKLEEELKKK